MLIVEVAHERNTLFFSFLDFDAFINPFCKLDTGKFKKIKMDYIAALLALMYCEPGAAVYNRVFLNALPPEGVNSWQIAPPAFLKSACAGHKAVQSIWVRR